MQPSFAPPESTDAVIAHGAVSRAHWLLLASATVAVGLGVLAVGWFGGAGPSLDEKRVLATRPPMPESWSQLRVFPGAFDDYVHDQFPPRSQLIAGLNYLRYRMGWSGFSRVIVGRDGWLFYDNDNHLAYSAATPALTQGDIDAWAAVYSARKQWLAARGIAYQVLMVPTKESIYPDKLPGWAQRARGAGWVSDQDLFRARFPADEFVDLRPAFAHAIAHGQRLFTTLDTHWNGTGAHVASGVVLDRLATSTRFTSLQPLPLSDFPRDAHSLEAHDLAAMLGIAAIPNGGFNLFDPAPPPAPASIEYLGPTAYWTTARVVTTGYSGPRLLMTVDSFSNALLPFLYPHFRQIVIAHNQDGSFRRDLIERFHPDIVMLEVIESGARFSMNASPNELFDSPTMPLRFSRADALLPPLGDDLQCNIEKVEVSAGSNAEHELEMSGWVAQVSHGRVAPTVRFILRSTQDSFTATFPVSVMRPDLPQYFHRGGIALSGFKLKATLQGVPSGHYQIATQQDFPDGIFECKLTFTLDVP